MQFTFLDKEGWLLYLCKNVFDKTFLKNGIWNLIMQHPLTELNFAGIKLRSFGKFLIIFSIDKTKNNKRIDFVSI